MDDHELVFLFLTKSNVIMRIENILDMIGMEGRSPHAPETFLSLLRNKTFTAKSMIIDLELPEFDEIVKEAKDLYPLMSIIVLYEPNQTEKLKKVQDQYNIKYDLSSKTRDKIAVLSLFEKIKQDRACNEEKNGNDGGRYTFIQTLGKGASSTVDLYFDKELKVKVAVKKMKVEGMDQDKYESIKKEVNNMEAIKVPTSIQFYGFSIENDNRLIYMEYADQGTIDQKIYQHKVSGKAFENEEILEYLIEIMLALYALNKKGMMHRDIKSENILLSEVQIGEEKCVIAKLSDLGISRKIDGVLGNLTQCGTPYYVSPEIAAGEARYDYKADIWSLGVVLYELIKLEKPWYEPELDTAGLFNLIFTTNYPPLPKNTDPRLKYLVKLMLKKDPARRASLTELLSLDFMYEKTMQMIKKYKWEDVEDFKSITEIKDSIHPFYFSLKLVDKEDFDLLVDTNQICCETNPVEYKASYFGTACKSARNGEEILEVLNDLEEAKTVLKTKETKEKILEKALEKKILIPLSHTLGNSEEFVEGFIDNPSKYFFKFSLDDFDQYSSKSDNQKIIETEYPEDIDYIALSQFILKNAKILYKANAKATKQETEFKLSGEPEYIKFLLGISLFQECDIFSIPYDEKDKSRLVFLLNVFEIMAFHFYFNFLQNNVKTKSGFFQYFQKDVSINYKFKNFSLSDLELMHVVFRGNKPVPGSYMRLVYNSDEKCKLLPEFNNQQVLFIFADLPESSRTIFNTKEIDEQFKDIAFDFIKTKIKYSNFELQLPPFLKQYINDFGPNDTADFPEGFLQFILDLMKAQREKSKPYNSRLTSAEDKALDFINDKIFISIKINKAKVTYSEV